MVSEGFVKLVLKMANRLEVEATRLRDICKAYGISPLDAHEGGTVVRISERTAWLGVVEYPTPSGVISKIEVYEGYRADPIIVDNFALYLIHEDEGRTFVMCRLTPFQYPHRLSSALGDLKDEIPLAVLKAVYEGLIMLRESVLSRLGRLDKFEEEVLGKVRVDAPALLNRWQSVLSFSGDSSDAKQVLLWAISASIFALLFDARRLQRECLKRKANPMELSPSGLMSYCPEASIRPIISRLSGKPETDGIRTLTVVYVCPPAPQSFFISLPVFEVERWEFLYMSAGVCLAWNEGRPSVAIRAGRLVSFSVDSPTAVLLPQALGRHIPPETPTAILKGVLEALEILYGVIQRRMLELGMPSLLPPVGFYLKPASGRKILLR
jgi:hypothetical protein